MTRTAAWLLGLSLVGCSSLPPAATPADFTQQIPGSAVAFRMVWIPEIEAWLGATEVTWDEYLLYAGFDELDPSAVDAISRPSKPLEVHPYDRDWGAGRRPAVGMSWRAAQIYCEWLTQKTGRRYRLPTEAEWQLACAAPDGDVDAVAWTSANTSGKTEPVGTKAPDANGLYDMLGNLAEYCATPFSDSEPERAVLRGGSWMDQPNAVQCDARLGFEDDWTLDDPEFPPGQWWIPDGDMLGFRVLCKREEQP